MPCGQGTHACISLFSCALFLSVYFAIVVKYSRLLFFSARKLSCGFSSVFFFPLSTATFFFFKILSVHVFGLSSETTFTLPLGVTQFPRNTFILYCLRVCLIMLMMYAVITVGTIVRSSIKVTSDRRQFVYQCVLCAAAEM